MKKRTFAAGSILVLLAAIMWSFAGAIVKYVSWSALSIGCVRGVLAAITIAVFANRKLLVRPTKAVWLGALGTFGTSTLFMLSTKLTTAANSIVLQYTAPAFVILMSLIFLKVKPKRIDLITVCFVFMGIMLFFLDHIGHGALVGDLLALLSGVTFGMVFFANSLPNANPMQASCLGCLMNIVLLPFFITDPAVWQSGAVEWIIMILMGIVQLGAAYILFSLGMRSTSAISASIICTIEPILNPVWTFLAVGEQPGKFALLGGIIVVLTITVYNVVSAKRKARRKECGMADISPEDQSEPDTKEKQECKG